MLVGFQRTGVVDESEIIDLVDPKALARADIDEAATVAWLRMAAEFAATGYPAPLLDVLCSVFRNGFTKGAAWEVKRCLEMFRGK